MKIAVIGTGYVGLVTGACLAEGGNEVVCADINSDKIRALGEGQVPIYEPGLRELIRKNVRGARLQFTTDVRAAVKQSLLVFIAVGTPTGSDGAAGLDSVFQVTETIAETMDDFKVVVIKSTVPVGTNERVRSLISDLTEQQFEVVSNPEFLKEGNAIQDFMKPERVIVGTASERVAELMKELYAPFVRTGKPIFVMSPASAGMTKYAANAMLASRISFMNELAKLCERTGADVEQVRSGIGTDSRIGSKFLFAGVGFGGSCFPKDLRALIRTGQEHQVPLRILAAVVETNREIQQHFLSKIRDHFDGELVGKQGG